MSKTEAASSAERDPRWAAVETRDEAADGAFVFSVRSTGIYCRPSCPARRAKPEHVAFHATCAEAERAGFRACRRCRPDGPPPREARAAMAVRACRTIERAERPPTLEDLARGAGVSAFHFHRLFKAATGVTPKAYADAERARRARAGLAEGGSVTSAMHGAGFNSNGRFYEASNAMLGMTPADYKAGGAGAEIRHAIRDCSLGKVLVGASRRGVCFVALGDDPDALERELVARFPKADLVGGDVAFGDLVEKVVALVERPAASLDLPLDIRGTAFQQRVWAALRDIPAGRTETYAEIARRIGAPKAVRAVGAACGANRLAVVVPCHRVVGSSGALTGFRWGVERKRALLRKERGEA